MNGNPVKKFLDTLFFSVQGGSPTGPLGSVAAVPPVSSTSVLTITNSYSSPVTFFMQLLPISGCSATTDVKAVFPTMTYVNPTLSGTTLGSVSLGATGSGTNSLTTTYTGPLSANFSVGTYNALCGTNLYPNGVNVAECTLNNSCQGQFAIETLDISLVNGLNSVFRWSIGGTKFNTVTNSNTPPKVVYTSKFENKGTYASNLLRPGVFPYGCTNCSNNSGAQTCPPSVCPPGCPQPPATSWNLTPRAYGACNPTTFLGCNFSRSATKSGGSITCQYLGPSSN